jgi:arylsulfatase A-like enzyme
MVTRMDRDIGVLLALLEELDLARDTIVIFTSDNGPTFNGGTDSVFFNSAAGLRGLKMQLYEGGIRVPLVIRWPGRIAAGGEVKLPVTHCDLLPTLAAIAGASGEVPADVDGLDLAPALFGGDVPDSRPPLYWEAASGGFQQAVRIDEFKGVRRNVRKEPNGPLELYDLRSDSSESTNVAAQHSEIVERMLEVMRRRTPSDIAAWNP